MKSGDAVSRQAQPAHERIPLGAAGTVQRAGALIDRQLDGAERYVYGGRLLQRLFDEFERECIE
jgi:hypothetical protein